jgi:hypothetical protein
VCSLTHPSLVSPNVAETVAARPSAPYPARVPDTERLDSPEVAADTSWCTRLNTASNIGSVSFPVKVFCWLGW